MKERFINMFLEEACYILDINFTGKSKDIRIREFEFAITFSLRASIMADDEEEKNIIEELEEELFNELFDK